jgi:hypothetical protein
MISSRWIAAGAMDVTAPCRWVQALAAAQTSLRIAIFRNSSPASRSSVAETYRLHLKMLRATRGVNHLPIGYHDRATNIQPNLRTINIGRE